MSTLGEMPRIKNNLSLFSATAIKLLQRLIFENDPGDRKNRERLRKFSGFNYNVNSKEYKDKIKYVTDNFSVNNLITVCNLLNLKDDGKLDELVERVVTNLNDLKLLGSSSVDADETDDEVSSEAETTSALNLSNVRSGSNLNEVPVSFRDVEGTIKHFSADDNYSVEKWISDFEETATLLSWNDIQKLIFAKKSLSGIAKLFLQSERNVNSWDKLKVLLTEEFGDKHNSAEIHMMLNKRKMKLNESFHEYFYVMKEIAIRGNVEDAALIHYIINGIQDSPTNKYVLYKSKNLAEFKENLTLYQKVCEDRQRIKSRSEFNEKHKFKNLTKKTSDIRCYVCGKIGHKSDSCVHKSKGFKCFKCNSFGHKSTDCKSKTEDTKKANLKISCENEGNNFFKVVEINGLKFKALLDSGSEISICKETVYHKLNSPELNTSKLTIVGFGNSQIKPKGYFTEEISIDNCKLPFNLYVVPDNLLKNDIILGYDLFVNTEVIINNAGVSIKEIEPEMNLMLIDVQDDDHVNIGINLKSQEKREIQKLVEEYVPCKTESTDIKMSITLKDDNPIFQRPRRLPFAERDIVDKQVDEWIKNGIVEPCSSEYASPVVVVRKKDNTPRVCIDYRKINRSIVKDRYPLPLIEDVLDRLQNARVFSTLDLKNGFFHVDVRSEDKPYTSFVTHSGQYQFLKVPFGLCNSPAVFQRYVNTVFRSLITEGTVLPYMDDIIVPATDVKEGIEKLRKVFDVARCHGLEINFKKSHFLKTRVEFLGHVIEDGKIYPSTLKTKAVLKFPEPSNLKQVQSFLGLAGYFRKFIPSYSIIAKPLSDLLKKGNNFKFDTQEKNAFNQLKTMLSKEPVLGIYHPRNETEVHTDASIDGYGAVLLQKSPHDNCFHPIYYMSRKTTPAERKYSSYELEVLAVIEALKKFRIYLLGIPFKIITDCAAFQKTMDKRDLATRVARWALLLEEFNYSIEHRSGSKMLHVDALSRSPVAMTITTENTLTRFKLAQEADDQIKTVKEVLKYNEYDNFCEKDGILYKFIEGQELLVVPEAMQTEIIRNAHEKGHYAIKRTEELIKQNYYIPKLKDKIEKLIANCVPCILINRKAGKQEGYLHPLHKESLPLHTYHIDHLGPLQSTNKNYKHIFAVIDGFTKFVWLYPTKSTSADEVIKKLEIQKSIFGNPVQIVSDRGSAFTSKEFNDYCLQQNIKHMSITTGLPRANGQVERLNRVIVAILSKLSIAEPTKWYNHVQKVQQAINSTFHRSINTTPFELLFGVKMRGEDDDNLQDLINTEIQEIFETTRDEAREDAKKQIAKIQHENQKTYNLRRKPPRTYEIGDIVAIKRTQFGPGLKLKPKFLGPYKVVKKKPNDTYDVLKEPTLQSDDTSFDGHTRTSTCAEFMKPWGSCYD